MKTRIIYTKFYQDSYILSLAPTERFLFLYLISNSHIGLSEYYEASKIIISFETGLNNSQIESTMDKFQKDKKFSFCGDWIKIINYQKYNNYVGSKNEIARENEVSLINVDIKEKLDRVSIGYPYPMDTSINHKSEIINKKSETKEEKVDKKIEEAEKILKGYNKYFSKSFKSVKVWYDNYLYWRGIYSYKEIAQAIINAKEDPWWRDKLTLEKLFRTRNKNGECDYIGDLLNK